MFRKLSNYTLSILRYATEIHGKLLCDVWVNTFTTICDLNNDVFKLQN